MEPDTNGEDQSLPPQQPLPGTGAVLPPGATPLPEQDEEAGLAQGGTKKQQAEVSGGDQPTADEAVPTPDTKIGLDALTSQESAIPAQVEVPSEGEAGTDQDSFTELESLQEAADEESESSAPTSHTEVLIGVENSPVASEGEGKSPPESPKATKETSEGGAGKSEEEVKEDSVESQTDFAVDKQVDPPIAEEPESSSRSEPDEVNPEVKIEPQEPQLEEELADKPQQPKIDMTVVEYDPKSELQNLKIKVDNSNIPQSVKDKANTMLLRLTRMVSMGNYTKEFESVESYIRWVTEIPYGKYSQDNLDLENARENLEKYHYGLNHVKDTIVEYLAVMKLQRGGATLEETMSGSEEMSRLQGSSSHAPILSFIGIQGVGKTSIAKSIANALNRKFVRVALGAMGNVAQIRGIPRGEPDAEPGQIIKALIRAGTMNPLILLDEMDKTSSESGLRADLMAALLEILDPEQNSTFVDHYLDFPIDLSNVMFITTANNLGGISAALLDRLEVIRFGSYTDEEKQEIARSYMLPKVREASGLTEEQLSFDDDVWPLVVRPLGFDAGVRQLERTITILARKVAKLIVQGDVEGVRITKENFREFIPEDIGVYS